MKIGLDFDGVISDCGELKRLGAKLLFDKDIPAAKFKKEIIIGEGLLTAEQYRQVQQQVYGNREIGIQMKPLPYVLELLPLLQEGNLTEIKIVTARGNLEASIAVEWMKLYGLKVPLEFTDNQEKTEFCKGLDVYIDDDLEKLEPLVGVVPNLYLMSHPYNSNINVDGIATRVRDWPHFFYKVLELLSKRN